MKNSTWWKLETINKLTNTFFTYHAVSLKLTQFISFRIFEKLRQYFGAQSESIPMSFVLGFYVSLIVKRWWEQYKLLPWPDTLALFISAAIPRDVCVLCEFILLKTPLLKLCFFMFFFYRMKESNKILDERGRMMRRNIMRYSVLAYVITLKRISLRVQKRFPTHQHLVDAGKIPSKIYMYKISFFYLILNPYVGIMLDSEKKIFELMDAKSPMSKYWMPLVWATNIINRARNEGIIKSDHIVQTLLVELSDIRRRLGALIGYDTVCVPLVYTQVRELFFFLF